VDIGFDSNLDPNSINEDDNFFGFLGSMGGSGLFVSGLAFLGVGLLPLILTGLATGAVIGWLFGSDPEELILKMKQEVYTKGFEKFGGSLDQIGEKISEGAVQAIDSRHDKATNAIQYSISILDENLKKQEIIYLEAVSSHSAKQDFVRLITTELACVESDFRALLTITD
jgi:hypothetical protein